MIIKEKCLHLCHHFLNVFSTFFTVFFLHFSFIQKSFRLAKMLFITWMVFVVLWLPGLLIFKIDGFKSVSGTGYHLLNAVILTNSTVNFIIYGTMNRTFRKAYISLIMCKKYWVTGVMFWSISSNCQAIFLFGHVGSAEMREHDKSSTHRIRRGEILVL